MMLRLIYTWLHSTFFNNITAVLITGVGLSLGGVYLKSKYDLWQAEREAQKRTEAVIDRCTRDEVARDEIEAEARDAVINDTDNSFINQ